MRISRRRFLANTAATGASGMITRDLAAVPGAIEDEPNRPLVISTWPFGKAANDIALKLIQNRGSVLDAVEKGIGLVEGDPSKRSVGLKGKPNSAGVVKVDACIMLGEG